MYLAAPVQYFWHFRRAGKKAERKEGEREKQRLLLYNQLKVLRFDAISLENL